MARGRIQVVIGKQVSCGVDSWAGQLPRRGLPIALLHGNVLRRREGLRDRHRVIRARGRRWELRTVRWLSERGVLRDKTERRRVPRLCEGVELAGCDQSLVQSSAFEHARADDDVGSCESAPSRVDCV